MPVDLGIAHELHRPRFSPPPSLSRLKQFFTCFLRGGVRVCLTVCRSVTGATRSSVVTVVNGYYRPPPVPPAPDREVQTIKARGMSLAGAFVLGFGSYSTAPIPVFAEAKGACVWLSSRKR